MNIFQLFTNCVATAIFCYSFINSLSKILQHKNLQLKYIQQ